MGDPYCSCRDPNTCSQVQPAPPVLADRRLVRRRQPEARPDPAVAPAAARNPRESLRVARRCPFQSGAGRTHRESRVFCRGRTDLPLETRWAAGLTPEELPAAGAAGDGRRIEELERQLAVRLTAAVPMDNPYGQSLWAIPTAS